ncbi:MAG: hypothetical protein ACFFCW_33120, partial [Candidatus Hodarchaeota archaeon]
MKKPNFVIFFIILCLTIFFPFVIYAGDTTIYYGWIIPDEYSDPWYQAFVNLMNQIDGQVYQNNFDTESELETKLSDVNDVFTDNDTIPEANIHSDIARDSEIIATKLDDFSTPDDNTDLNATASTHGLLPKLSNNSNEYLNG